jgi:hypothetical protein
MKHIKLEKEEQNMHQTDRRKKKPTQRNIHEHLENPKL